MEAIKTILAGTPLWLLLILSGSLILVILLASRLGSALRFRRDLKRVQQDPDRYAAPFKQRHPARTLKRRSWALERYFRKHGSELVSLLGVDDIWVEGLRSRRRKGDFQRVLRYAPGKGLFLCFLISLERKRMAPILFAWLEQSRELLPLRRLALAGRGERFDGREAYQIFKDRLGEIREMTGDPEWPVRYFAVKVLLHDPENRSRRALWDAFEDPYPLIRRTIATELNSDQREKLYQRLLPLALADPVLEVRKAAWQRIVHYYADLYTVDPQQLSEEEAFHVLELLPQGGKAEENFALSYLDSPNLELRFVAAGYLERCGTLKRLCLEVDLGDREGLERNYRLLEQAGEVNRTGFLSVIRETQNPAALLICARILAQAGDRGYIVTLAKKVFAQFHQQKELLPVYQAAVECISQRGTEEALRLLDRELYRRRGQQELMELLLPALPERGDFIYIDTLFSFLKDPDFKARDALRKSLASMAQPLVLEQVFEIIKADREAYPHLVRKEAVKLLVELDLPYCLQTILENLMVLPLEEAKEYTKILATFPEQVFKRKVELLLDASDAKVRAYLIAALAVTEERDFLKSIRTFLKDADPDVRIATVWALSEFKDYRSLNQAVSMLRDPVERVRREVAMALGRYGSEQTLQNLKEILFEDHEIQAVKAAAILGLGLSSSLNSVDILVERLGGEGELSTEIVRALAGKNEKREVTRLLERFKDASPSLRDRIAQVFKEKGEVGEPAVVELLRADLPSLKPLLAEILEATGQVEAKIRRLAHRDPGVRREAAEFLSLVGSQAAFRGMVLAARDPAEEVRVKVVKALEKLETEAGAEILRTLEKDPDKKVRKYTHWALERIKAKKL